MSETATKEHQPSDKAKNLSARLVAVQAIYQIMQNATPAKDVLNQYLEKADDMEIDGEKIVTPNGALLKKILLGVDDRAKDLESILEANYQQNKDEKPKLEPLLQSIALCAAFELLDHQDIDSPIIINDYLNVTHGFYEKGEVSLINGVLDAVSKAVRD